MREPTWAAHLIHMSRRSLAAEWSPVVHCFDASWWGFGIVRKRVRKEVVRDTARRCERWRFTREHEDRWRSRHTDGDPAIRAPGESGRRLKWSPCQRIKDEEAKDTETVRLTTHASDPNDLITAFIKHGEAEWGKVHIEDESGSEPSQWWGEAKVVKKKDDDSSSEPSQWWGEPPDKTTAEKRSLTHW